MRKVRVAIAQINTIVGAFEKNIDKILEYAHKANKLKPDIIVFPELAVCGFPPDDLLLQPGFLKKAGNVIDKIVRETSQINSIIIVGFPEYDEETYNSAAIIFRGRVWDIYRKIYFPDYGIFNERKYFTPGKNITLYETPDFRFCVGICEDIRHPQDSVAGEAFSEKCKLVLNINGSPYHIGKPKLRETMISIWASHNAKAVAYVNSIGGQDELVFDGQSFAVDAEGNIICRGKAFSEELILLDFELDDLPHRRLHDHQYREPDMNPVKIPYIWKQNKPEIKTIIHKPPERLEEIWNALVLGLGDYLRKNGFESAVLGLSGGIDSALVATIATDAIGADNVNGIFMPTKFSSSQSYNDAKKLAEILGINFSVIEIEELYKNYLEILAPHFKGSEFDVTEENIQARIRGNIIMAFSNKFGCLPLATGNKSETSVGYATLYGDMAGGFAVLADVPKTMVWELAGYRNEAAGKELIPENIINKPPSAELRKDQLDTDSLPPYEVLDRILDYYIEENMSVDEIATETGFDRELIAKVVRMVARSEFKRRQAPPGIKITAYAFGIDRKIPITSG